MRKALKQRILILDGAMGTMIQRRGLTEADYRGERFKQWPVPLKGNNDLLVLTRPDIISDIHTQYLEAGADIIETNTFNAQRISMRDYGMEELVREINLEGARLARRIADEYTARQPDKPRFVAGSVGPTNKTASMSPDVENPSLRAVTFDELVDAYREQMVALIQGGVDALLLETVFDTLNVKAALFAAQQAMLESGRRVELMVSATVADSSGRLLAGQTIRAFLASIAHADLLSVGLNCSFGAKDLKPYLEEMSAYAPWCVSAHPNAGLPNQLGLYDETPETMAAHVKPYIDERLVNIIGGCCGTTPEHIARYPALLEGAIPRTPHEDTHELVLSGLEATSISSNSSERATGGEVFTIGERCNVAGSRKFLRLIKEKNYEEALHIARKQIEDGAQAIDINMDDGMLNAPAEMTVFLNYIASEPEIAKVPVMIDSSRWEAIEAGLKCVQGKCIVNSISLKEGEDAFLNKARLIRSYGAAVVVMAFDEQGQADTYERRIGICSRAYRLLVEQAGFPPQDIIFDPNVLAIATGIEAHNHYAVDFLDTVSWIKAHLPYAKVSGGISNLSFAFRGNNAVREAIHAVFLHHAVRCGLDMAIVNPTTRLHYNELEAGLKERVEDVVLDTRPDATERLIALAEQLKATEGNTTPQHTDAWRTLGLDDRLAYALQKGISDYLADDLQEALQAYDSPVDIIEKPLMRGMGIVGELFGAGQMFLPQVVKTARTMKQAVALLQPHLEALRKNESRSSAGKVLIATVKGDVHDIGKNIVSVILACNNYEVIDLGVMVPAETIVETALREQVDIVGLSGLITPSLEEMCHVASALEQAGACMPLLIGGATTSELHTAVRIAPLYHAPVVHVKDASVNAQVIARLLDATTHDSYVAELHETQNRLRRQQDTAQDTANTLSYEEARKRKPKIF